VGDDGSNEPVINTEEDDLETKKCVIDDKKLPVELCTDVVADAEDAITTSITTEGENGDNTGELFFTSILYYRV